VKWRAAQPRRYRRCIPPDATTRCTLRRCSIYIYIYTRTHTHIENIIHRVVTTREGCAAPLVGLNDSGWASSAAKALRRRRRRRHRISRTNLRPRGCFFAGCQQFVCVRPAVGVVQLQL
jgi:hypothetical protein